MLNAVLRFNFVKSVFGIKLKSFCCCINCNNPVLETLHLYMEFLLEILRSLEVVGSGLEGVDEQNFEEKLGPLAGRFVGTYGMSFV